MFNPFWAKAEELGVLIFIHPASFAEGQRRFQGNGFLPNVIGNPLETTVAFSHLIFEGTLDRYPDLKICGATGEATLPPTVAERITAWSRARTASRSKNIPANISSNSCIAIRLCLPPRACAIWSLKS